MITVSLDVERSSPVSPFEMVTSTQYGLGLTVGKDIISSLDTLLRKGYKMWWSVPYIKVSKIQYKIICGQETNRSGPLLKI